MHGIQPSATGDMIVTQGASVSDSLSNVTGTVTKKFNRTTQALIGPRQCQGYSIQGHVVWQQAEPAPYYGRYSVCAGSS